MYEVIKLVQVTFTKNEHDVQVPSESAAEVFADVRSISSSEFFNAGNAGMKPAYKFVINYDEYSGETLVEYEGKRYVIYRTYRPSEDRLELYVEGRLGA